MSIWYGTDGIRNVYKFLEKLDRLTSLELLFPVGKGFWGNYTPNVRLCDVMPMSSMGLTLSTLSLRGISVKEDELMRLVARHGPTLKTLYLELVHLVATGSWKDVLQQLLSKSKLRIAEIDMLFSWEEQASRNRIIV